MNRDELDLVGYVLLASSSLFVIIDPIATVPAFLAMTPNDTPRERVRMARVACLVSAIILLVFAATGNFIFTFFGITLPAFRIAGSILLLLIALDMLRAQRSRVRETAEETDAGAAKEDIAITPLAVPMLAGPGAISTVILLHNRATGLPQHLALLGCIVLVCAAAYGIFAVSAHGAKWLNPIFLRLSTRIMGLLLAAIAMQFLVNAMTDLGLINVRPAPP
jgi:multiple antibiotic resistance protein